MAAARDPLLSSQERSNSAKLGKLIFHVGTLVLRSLFDAHLAPSRLKNRLTSKVEILRSLRDSNLISPGEWKLLFPDDGSSPTSQNMEIHLFLVLFQNICGLPKPSTGWDKEPTVSVEGYFVSENLAKFNWLISEVAKRTNTDGVENMYFNLYWNEITNVFNTLGFEFPFSIEEVKHQPMDKDEEDKYYRLLVEWTRKKIQNQDVAAHSVQEATETINSVLQRQDETKSQLTQSTKVPFTWSTSSIIGTGCKGTKVYHGQLTSNGREVAVKKMYNGVFDKGEAEKLRKCIHPNIIRCFATHEEDEFFYLALEPGEKTLMVCIDENKFDSSCGDLSVEKCFVEIASGVAYLHENSICHRDIKPENILLMAKNDEYSSHRFVLADFNCARDVPSGETISTNSTVGTRGWMAPEMCGVGSRRTLKVDIFSLGCVCYYTLTKKHPYGGDGETMQLSVCQNNINKKQSPSNFIYRFESYKHFAKLLLRMIHADVDKRPAASEVFEDLQSLYKQKVRKFEEPSFHTNKASEEEKEEDVEEEEDEEEEEATIQHMMVGQQNMQHQPQTFQRPPRIQGSAQFFPPPGRPISIRPSHPSPQQNPMYQSPPTGPQMIPFVSPQGQPTFTPQQKQYVQHQVRKFEKPNFHTNKASEEEEEEDVEEEEDEEEEEEDEEEEEVNPAQQQVAQMNPTAPRGTQMFEAVKESLSRKRRNDDNDNRIDGPRRPHAIMPTAIVPHSKAKGVDFCGTKDYYYIVRSDVGVYMRSRDFNGESEIEVFDLHLSCKNGEHYLASVEEYFYIIKGDNYRRVSNMNKDTDAKVFSLHPNCRGGDSYYSINNYFYIVFLDRGFYRKTSDMNKDSDSVEFPIHNNCKNGLYYWGCGHRVYFVKPAGDWGVEYHRTSHMDRDTDGQTFSMHKSVVDFLPGGVAITEGTTDGKWQLAKSFINPSDSVVNWTKKVSHQQGVKKSVLSSMEHNWFIYSTIPYAAGNLSGAFVQKQFALEVQYGGKKVDTKTQSWDDVKTVTEKIDLTLKPKQQVWVWYYVLGLGEDDILFCRDMQITNTIDPPTNDPLPPSE